MILRILSHLVGISVYEMTSKCQVTKQLISLFGLVAFLWISLPLPLAYAQVETTEAESRKKWTIYGDHFKSIGDDSSDFAKKVANHGHIMLQTELLNATEGSGIVLLFVIATEEIASLLKQISELQKMPDKFDKWSQEEKTKLMLAKYVILPKFLCKDDDNVRIDASIFPVKEGATSMCCSSSFGIQEFDSGIRQLADLLAKKIFKREGIKYSSEMKRYPRIGFRDFKNYTGDGKDDKYRLLLPKLICSILSTKNKDNKINLIRIKLTETDFKKTDHQIATVYRLDILITGYFLRAGEQLNLCCDMSYASGRMKSSVQEEIKNERILLEKIDEVADEIMVELMK